MSNKENRIPKVKHDKFYTRAKSERLLTAGVDPNATFVDSKGATLRRYLDHTNYHVRAKAFRKLGSPFPEDTEECEKLCKSLHIKNPKPVAETPSEEV